MSSPRSRCSGERCVELHVVERVREDLRAPDERRSARRGRRTAARCGTRGRRRRARARAARGCCSERRPQSCGRIEQAEQRRRRATARAARRAQIDKQHDLAPQVVADLDLFLALVRQLVHGVVALRLEEEVADLPRPHRARASRPARRCSGLIASRAYDVRKLQALSRWRRLIDAAVVIEAVIVPALLAKLGEEAVWSSDGLSMVRRIDYPLGARDA